MQEVNHYHDVDKIIKFGLVSDTHCSSRYEQHSYLELAYDDFLKEGIKRVYHAGDLSEGWYQNRPGHIFELHKIGFDQQRDYIVKTYPRRDGVETDVIGGNHDATHQKNGGADIVAAVCKERADMHYLGQADAKVWLTPKVDMDLKHPDGGSSYAYSYRPQKIVESLPGGDKPKIMVIGHYHKNFFMFYRGVFIICIPSFIRQTPFMNGLALVSDVGYVIIELKTNENGDVIELTPRFKMFYKMLDEDYVH
jgi:predicted phosphodiesterase